MAERLPALDRALLPDGARVLCALSGGADSVCLLALLLREGRGLKICAAHYNHCLRGAESERDEAFARALCADWGVPLALGRGDVRGLAAREGLSLEDAARRLRYEFLESAADEAGAELIATAHTASDNAETLLLHLARGAGGAGLAGIPPRRGRVVRPLLGWTRADVEAYLAANGVAHVEDSSNALDDAARNRVRHGAIPALESVNPAFALAALRASKALRTDEEYLASEAARAFETLWDGAALDIPGLLALPEALRRRVLRAAAGERAESVHLEALEALCRAGSPSGALDLPGTRVRREYARLVFGGADGAPTLPPRELRAGERVLLPECGLAVTADIVEMSADVQSSFNTFSFSCGKICGKLFVTSRRGGDALVLAGRAGTRTVKKLLTDAKIPRRRRSLVPVIRDEEGVLALAGFGQAERGLARPGERALRVRITEFVEERDR